jgi:hypothetical protein
VHELGDDLGELISRLKQEAFDAVIDLHHNLRTARIKRALGIPAHSFPKLNIEKWLLVNFKMDRMPRLHIVDRYMSTVEHLGVKNDDKGLELFIPAGREVPNSSGPHRIKPDTRCLPSVQRTPPSAYLQHKLIELARLIEGPIVIIGGKEDQPVAAPSAMRSWPAYSMPRATTTSWAAHRSSAGAKRDRARQRGHAHRLCVRQARGERMGQHGPRSSAWGLTAYSIRSARIISEVKDLSCRPVQQDRP